MAELQIIVASLWAKGTYNMLIIWNLSVVFFAHTTKADYQLMYMWRT